MPTVSLLHPTDPPAGQNRLLGELQDAIASGNYTHLRIASAWVRMGPLRRLAPVLEPWIKQQGGKVRAVFGVDKRATGQQALRYALETFKSVYITTLEPANPRRVIFHPKFYLFHGRKSALLFIGSQNLTVGGTETNFEAGARIKIALPGDAALLDDAKAMWKALKTHLATRRLTDEYLQSLISQGLLLDETQPRPGAPDEGEDIEDGGDVDGSKKYGMVSPIFLPKPASKVPSTKKGSGKKQVTTTPGAPEAIVVSPEDDASAEAFAIELGKKGNGEFLLTRRILDEHPEFLGTLNEDSTPKDTSIDSPSYPEGRRRLNIRVFDTLGTLIQQKSLDALFIHYERKGELRVTIGIEIENLFDQFAVMLMRRTGVNPRTYAVEIHPPDSAAAKALMVGADKLPSGGAAQARHFVWL